MPTVDFPSIEPTMITLESVDNTIYNRTLSGRETRTKVGSQFYRITYKFANLTETQKRQLSGHYAAARGGFLDFYLTLPTFIKNGSGDTTATITVGSGSAGAYGCTYTKVSTDNETVFKAGDLIYFSNHDKVYEVSVDSTSTGSSGTVYFNPALRSGVTSSHTIEYQGVKMLVRYAKNLEYELENNSFSSLDIIFEEVIT